MKPDPPSLHPLCAELRRVRVAAGLTLAEVAEKTGMSLQQVGAYERGIYEPRITQLERWAAALNLSVRLQ